jgi:hypothetical protein
MNDFRPENRISKLVPKPHPGPRAVETSTARYRLQKSTFLTQGCGTGTENQFPYSIGYFVEV